MSDEPARADRPDPRPNILVIAADTLRTAYLGCYGNAAMHTPKLDRLAAESVRFTHAHPEALPTIPTRRTVHGGRRVFPFREYQPVSWDNVYLPGWQPLARDEPTVAETLVAAGYQTGFVADVPHYFVPGMNFTRGFLQWQFTRGQAEDRWGALAAADPARLGRYRGREQLIRRHLVNVRPERPEEEWPTARTFRWAQRFVEENTSAQPWYLYVDSFTPHETWEAPLHYYDLYGSRAEREPVWLNVPYGPLSETPALEPQLASVRANYSGLVSMVDHWVGLLLATVDRVGQRANTLVIFYSDHGTNFADNAEGVVGKPAGYMYRGTMDIPLLMRLPDRSGAGVACDALVSTVDIPATVIDAAGAGGDLPVDGTTLRPAARGALAGSDYATCRYGNHVWYRDERSWFFSTLEFGEPRLFDLEADPDCRHNIAERAPERCAEARERILADAGGELIHHEAPAPTDAVGRREPGKAS